MEKVKPRDMRLGDVIQSYDGPFGTSIVSKIADSMVTLQRPNGRADDYSYGGNEGNGNQVTVLTGVETYSLWLDSEATFLVWSRGNVR